MKVQASLRSVYANQRPLAERLKTHVDAAILAGKPARWHYESRIKELESFCAKIETGRVPKPDALEDMLAGMIVVPNSLAIPDAISFVSSLFTVSYRRPLTDLETSKPAETFRFDDLRMYCQRMNDGTRPKEPLDDIIFEIQIKTFLQHAWGIATHDLSYKTDEVRWGKDRIVAHLRATIEHAELSILEASSLSLSPMLELTNSRTNEIREIIAAFEATWPRDELPTNLRSLADTIHQILQGASISVADFAKLLSDEKTRLGGTMRLNLSPYGVSIEVLLKHRLKDVERMLRVGRNRILVTPEMDVPAGFPPARIKTKVVQLA